MLKYGFIIIFIIGLSTNLLAQNASVSGQVLVEGQAVEFAFVTVDGLGYSAMTAKNGRFKLINLPEGDLVIIATYVGYKSESQRIFLNSGDSAVDVIFNLDEMEVGIEEIVVTGTKTFERRTRSAVSVNVLSSKTLENVQACNLAEGLKFQPGLRVETDCQTCNYTQLRMNGLQGGYTQILINGRPIFSPLTGLYGLEQIPVNMIERVEVVKGGGASLYGSSAVGGTVNVITKTPKTNSFALSQEFIRINNKSSEHQTLGNATIVAPNRNSGLTLHFAKREREIYDHNNDIFSELPSLSSTSIGASMFYLPNLNQKIELNISNLQEYRYGGEITVKPAYLAEQSEERTHNVWLGTIDYQINSNDGNSTFITYLAWQNTVRDHYTGIIPDSGIELQTHLEDPPYGLSKSKTLNAGIQFNHRMHKGIKGTNVLIIGTEYLLDDVFDYIPKYNFKVDQLTKNFGLFVQSNWKIFPQLSLLTGLRMDKHNLVNKPIISPRTSLLYLLNKNTQFRMNFGTGFRSPQAFDADLHIAFAGGGVSRVSLSPELEPERSHSFSSSINFDRPAEQFIFGFTVDAFYTRLNRAFILQPIGSDAHGELFEKQNGQGATVQGTTFEIRANYNKRAQIETGFTFQLSQFDNPVSYIDGLEGIKEFVRTPNTYGYAVLSIMPKGNFSSTLNYVYTGPMKVPHFAGAPNQIVDEIFTSSSFSDLSVKADYRFQIGSSSNNLVAFAGVKNIFNSYQDTFDIEKNRDSNFIYGPSLPRTFFIGFKIQSF